nr:uncharacterized protein LOC108074028 isoform X3 [Drosophila kikkawai]
MANGKFLVKTQWKMLIFSASKNPMKINNQVFGGRLAHLLITLVLHILVFGYTTGESQ